MKRFVWLIVLFALVQLGVLALLVLLSLPPDNYHAAVLDKERLLKEAPSPRVVLVGGSGLAFGIDSATLTEALGGTYRVVNMGLHAGLGLDFMLNETLDGLRKGDVVVLSPEYDIVWRDEPNHLDIAEVLRFAPSAGRFVERRHWWPTLRSAVLIQPPVMLHDIAVNALRNVTPGLGSGGVYYRSAFNSSGDNRSGSQLESAYEPKAEELVAHVDEADYARNLETIAAFAALARDRGAQVYYMPPPIPNDRYALSPSTYERTTADIERRAGVTVVGSPAQESFPNGSFLNSGDHLRGGAVFDHTRRLAEGLLSAWNGQEPQ